MDGILYAVGGHDGPLVRKSVEAFDPTKDQVNIMRFRARVIRQMCAYLFCSGPQ